MFQRHKSPSSAIVVLLLLFLFLLIIPSLSSTSLFPASSSSSSSSPFSSTQLELGLGLGLVEAVDYTSQNGIGPAVTDFSWPPTDAPNLQDRILDVSHKLDSISVRPSQNTPNCDLEIRGVNVDLLKVDETQNPTRTNPNKCRLLVVDSVVVVFGLVCEMFNNFDIEIRNCTIAEAYIGKPSGTVFVQIFGGTSVKFFNNNFSSDLFVARGASSLMPSRLQGCREQVGAYVSPQFFFRRVQWGTRTEFTFVGNQVYSHNTQKIFVRDSGSFFMTCDFRIGSSTGANPAALEKTCRGFNISSNFFSILTFSKVNSTPTAARIRSFALEWSNIDSVDGSSFHQLVIEKNFVTVTIPPDLSPGPDLNYYHEFGAFSIQYINLRNVGTFSVRNNTVTFGRDLDGGRIDPLTPMTTNVYIGGIVLKLLSFANQYDGVTRTEISGVSEIQFCENFVDFTSDQIPRSTYFRSFYVVSLRISPNNARGQPDKSPLVDDVPDVVQRVGVFNASYNKALKAVSGHEYVDTVRIALCVHTASCPVWIISNNEMDVFTHYFAGVVLINLWYLDGVSLIDISYNRGDIKYMDPSLDPSAAAGKRYLPDLSWASHIVEFNMAKTCGGGERPPNKIGNLLNVDEMRVIGNTGYIMSNRSGEGLNFNVDMSFGIKNFTVAYNTISVFTRPDVTGYLAESIYGLFGLGYDAGAGGPSADRIGVATGIFALGGISDSELISFRNNIFHIDGGAGTATSGIAWTGRFNSSNVVLQSFNDNYIRVKNAYSVAVSHNSAGIFRTCAGFDFGLEYIEFLRNDIELILRDEGCAVTFCAGISWSTGAVAINTKSFRVEENKILVVNPGNFPAGDSSQNPRGQSAAAVSIQLADTSPNGIVFPEIDPSDPSALITLFTTLFPLQIGPCTVFGFEEIYIAKNHLEVSGSYRTAIVTVGGSTYFSQWDNEDYDEIEKNETLFETDGTTTTSTSTTTSSSPPPPTTATTSSSFVRPQKRMSPTSRGIFLIDNYMKLENRLFSQLHCVLCFVIATGSSVIQTASSFVNAVDGSPISQLANLRVRELGIGTEQRMTLNEVRFDNCTVIATAGTPALVAFMGKTYIRKFSVFNSDISLHVDGDKEPNVGNYFSPKFVENTNSKGWAVGLIKTFGPNDKFGGSVLNSFLLRKSLQVVNSSVRVVAKGGTKTPAAAMGIDVEWTTVDVPASVNPDSVYEKDPQVLEHLRKVQQTSQEPSIQISSSKFHIEAKHNNKQSSSSNSFLSSAQVISLGRQDNSQFCSLRIDDESSLHAEAQVAQVMYLLGNACRDPITKQETQRTRLLFNNSNASISLLEIKDFSKKALNIKGDWKSALFTLRLGTNLTITGKSNLSTMNLELSFPEKVLKNAEKTWLKEKQDKLDGVYYSPSSPSIEKANFAPLQFASATIQGDSTSSPFSENILELDDADFSLYQNETFLLSLAPQNSYSSSRLRFSQMIKDLSYPAGCCEAAQGGAPPASLDQLRNNLFSFARIKCFKFFSRVLPKNAPFFRTFGSFGGGGNFLYEYCEDYSWTPTASRSISQIPFCAPIKLKPLLPSSSSSSSSSSSVLSYEEEDNDVTTTIQEQRSIVKLRGTTKRETIVLILTSQSENSMYSSEAQKQNRKVPQGGAVFPGLEQAESFTSFRLRPAVESGGDNNDNNNENASPFSVPLQVSSLRDRALNLTTTSKPQNTKEFHQQQAASRLIDQIDSGIIVSLDENVAKVKSARVAGRFAVSLQLSYNGALDELGQEIQQTGTTTTSRRTSYVVRVAISPNIFSCIWNNDFALSGGKAMSENELESRAAQDFFRDPKTGLLWPIARFYLYPRRESFISAEVLAATRSLATFSVFASAVVSSNTMALSRLNRFKAMQQMSDCSFSDTDALSSTETLLSFGFGQEIGYYQRGAVTTNLCLTLICFVLLFGPAFYRWKQQEEKLKKKKLGEEAKKKKQEREEMKKQLLGGSSGYYSSREQQEKEEEQKREKELQKEKKKKFQKFPLTIFDFAHSFWLPSHLTIVWIAFIQGTMASSTALLRQYASGSGSSSSSETTTKSFTRSNTDLFLIVFPTLFTTYVLFWVLDVITRRMTNNPQLSYVEFRKPVSAMSSTSDMYYDYEDYQNDDFDFDLHYQQQLEKEEKMAKRAENIKKMMQDQEQEQEGEDEEKEEEEENENNNNNNADNKEKNKKKQGGGGGEKEPKIKSSLMLSWFPTCPECNGTSTLVKRDKTYDFLLQDKRTELERRILELKQESGKINNNNNNKEKELEEKIKHLRYSIMHRRPIRPRFRPTDFFLFRAVAWFFSVYGEWVEKKLASPAAVESFHEKRKKEQKQQRQQQQQQQNYENEDDDGDDETEVDDHHLLNSSRSNSSSSWSWSKKKNNNNKKIPHHRHQHQRRPAGHILFYMDHAAFLDDNSYRGRIVQLFEWGTAVLVAVLSGISPSGEDSNQASCTILTGVMALLNCIPIAISLMLHHPYRRRPLQFFYVVTGILLSLIGVAVALSKVVSSFTWWHGVVDLLQIFFDITCFMKLAVDVTDILWFVQAEYLFLPFFLILHLFRHSNFAVKKKKKKNTEENKKLFLLSLEEKKKLAEERKKFFAVAGDVEEDDNMEGVELNTVFSDGGGVKRKRRHLKSEAWDIDGTTETIAPRRSSSVPHHQVQQQQHHHHQQQTNFSAKRR